MATRKAVSTKVVVGLFFLIIGIGVTVLGVKYMCEAKASKSWPTTSAKITKSVVDVKREGVGQSEKRMYSAEISFDYTVEGIKHSSSKVWIGGLSRTNRKSRSQKIVDKYKVGSTAKAFYDPNDPRMAILEPGLSHASVTVTIIGLVFSILGVLIMAFGRVISRTA